jgi:serine/threonine protein kinase
MIGRRLAHYDITAHLGSGGMGEVYQATDTKLGRSVALKFLPESVAHDRERVARFRQEARTLASLNHPHVAAIHGLEEVEGRRFLIMEYVPGETLAERVGRRPIPLDEALSIARQIAEALEAAHEKGIVHRDLKPSNVKITPGGQVKVLDFGLAKLGESQADGRGGEGLSDLATPATAITHTGVVLGTAAYMAPEQARGHDVDSRADIFAFGCVLYEMLAGRRAFDGDNVAEIVSRVLQREPDWSRLPSSVPSSIRQLMRLCLNKDPKKRRQSAGDVRIDLEQALAEPVDALPRVASRRVKLARLAWIASASLLISALAVPAWIHFREVPASEVRLQIQTPPTLRPLHFALSPDGRYIAFVASESSGDGPQRLYLRAMDNTVARPLARTEGAQHPFWSADSRSLGFFASEKLFRIDLSGGPPQPLATAVNPQGGAWSEDGTILFSPNTVSPLLSVPESGGPSVAVTHLDPPRQTGHMRPSFLPGERRFLFYAQGEGEVSGTYLASLDGGTPRRLTAATSAEFLQPDRIVFIQEGALVTRRFDATQGELTGDLLTLADSLRQGAFSVSTTGAVAYRAGGGVLTRMTWFDRFGTFQKNESFNLNAPDLSPNGRHLAFDATARGNRDVWLRDLEHGGDPLRFTTHPDVDGFPLWSPDDLQIVFESKRNGNFDLWIKPFSGAADTEKFLYGTADNEWPLDWSNDGRFLLYRRSNLNYASSDLLALPMTGEDRTPVVVANSSFEERLGEFSPDGNWVAYETDESGRREIKVQAFPDPRGVVYPVSTSGGTAPRWSSNGKSIYFATEEKMMVVRVTATGPALQLGPPVPLFSVHVPFQVFRPQYVIADDGRFLVSNLQVDDSGVTPITLILNCNLSGAGPD